MLFLYAKRFPHAFRGLRYAFLHDFSYRWQVILLAVSIATFAYFFGPLEKVEWLFLILAAALVLITELQNSSFEAALDRMHPERHEQIGQSKDMAAGAVLTAGLFLLFVMVMIVLF